MPETVPSPSASTRSEPPVPGITLPKGGGAVRGIGEKFSSNPVNGTGSTSVPIATSPGRSGFGPQLSLAYDSGSGNGPFGIGWHLSLPAITRKTDKGLPEYRDASESDVYVLSDAEDLVPVLDPDNEWRRANPRPVRTVDGEDYYVERYRPRIDGLFSRIERWTHVATSVIHWRSITRDNVTTLYGRDNGSRIYGPADVDPTHPRRIFSWLICQRHDDKGNAIVYEYKPDDSADVREAAAHERNRDDASRRANRYIKHIRYGNEVSLLIEPDLTAARWHFEVVFDYGEHDALRPLPDDGGGWPCRDDPFSSHRSGFDVRTYRLCQRVLMFHHFKDEDKVGENCLVRSTEFSYRTSPVASFITSVTHSGYKRDNAGGYVKRSMPPVEFEYSEATLVDAIREIDATSLENMPVGVDGANCRFVDLDGEGISGVLMQQANAWLYKANRGGAEFGPLETIATQPAGTPVADGEYQLLDLAGDGQLDVVTLAPPMAGFFERTADRGWETFRPFEQLPRLLWDDPNLRFIDLDGDGHADVLVTETDAFTWFPSYAEAGFGAGRQVSVAADEEKGPQLVFADGTQSIFLADMCGDGLTDLVRIRNGEVCYWPNLGYGRFGRRIPMDRAPQFEAPDLFDQRRMRLADIDGSGTTDIIYLGHDGVRLYFNESGNSWSAAHPLKQFPDINDVVDINAVDLFGNGTACLVWSSPLPEARPAMRYIDLMGGVKPHLLVASRNNLGAETHVQYAPSTRFYLDDKRAGKPWITRLPFPVHVVERVTTIDRINRNRLVTRYAYHHGYFDGAEREFRGFGLVEQWDTEELAVFTSGAVLPDETNGDPASHVPPAHTKTWFHTGAMLDAERISKQFEEEYYREPGVSDAQYEAVLLPDSVLPNSIRRADGTRLAYQLTNDEVREALRAMKGAMLRREVYAADGSPAQDRPYSVSERNYTIEVVQPAGAERHAVFTTHAREVAEYQYERALYAVNGDLRADPRIQHTMTLEVDAYGNVLNEAAISYGRRFPDAALPAPADRDTQGRSLITWSVHRFTNPIDDSALFPDDYRAPLNADSRTFEFTGLAPENNARHFSFAEWARNGLALANDAAEIQYEDSATGLVTQRRLIEHARTLYRPDDLGTARNDDPRALLPLLALQPRALPGEKYTLAFTPGLLTQVFQRDGVPLLPTPADVLGVLGAQVADRGGYLSGQQLKADGRFPASDPADRWWIPAGRVLLSSDASHTAAEELAYARQHFVVPGRFTDPFGNTTRVKYDGYDLLTVDTRDAVENGVVAENDYRMLQPWRVTDPNGNRTQVAFDALGMVVGTAVMGKPAENVGDLLAAFDEDLTQVQLDAFHDAADPRVPAAGLLQSATTRIIYDVGRYRSSQQAHPDAPNEWLPVYVAAVARETHASDGPPAGGLRIQVSFSYSDGFGRVIQQKIQAAPGPVVDGGPIVDPRWIGSGWTIFNNKAKPVRQYEPFYSRLPQKRHRFEFGAAYGVSSILFYDPLDRVVATLNPNHTYEKVVFDAWQQTTYDANDTVAARGTETGDPRTDPHIRGYVGPYFANLPVIAGQPWTTWQQQRQGAAVDAQEQAAADKAAAHANTPTTAHLDALGRTFLTIARNRVVCANHALDGTEGAFATRVALDIEGNQRAVRDAIAKARNAAGVEVADDLGRIVVRYAYDMLGHRIHQHSMEAGARWMLDDVVGHPIRAWDSRGHTTRTAHDALRRPVRIFVTGADPAVPNQELLTERLVYGEQHPEDVQRNLRGTLYLHVDQAGAVTTEARDFKGNVLRSTRRIATDYRHVVAWTAVDAALPVDAVTKFDPVPLEAAIAAAVDAGTYATSTTYDALNRVTTLTTPHTNAMAASIIRPGYNEASLLQRVDANLRGAAASGTPAWTAYVRNIDYDVKRQRKRIDYGNDVSTSYAYDELTFRLTHLLTERNAVAFPGDCPDPPPAGWPGCQVQSLYYTYDPSGNITHLRDDAQQTIYFQNRRVEPSADYTYDALYRLIQATGREHLGQAGVAVPHSHDDAQRMRRPHPNDGAAMSRYCEKYVFDAVGNLLAMSHHGACTAAASWTRSYAYDEASLIENGALGTLRKTSNRLSSTTTGNGTPVTEPYVHDAHGNMSRMPHLGGAHPDPNMWWDYRDQLRQTDMGGGGTAYYVYDAAGQRVRKVWEKPGNLIEERVYLGGLEIYRRRQGTQRLERETLHIMDDAQRVALVETRTTDTALVDVAPAQLTRFQFGNHLGSSSLELDDAAQVIAYEEYTPFGSTSYQAVRSQTETPRRYRYTAMERDEETGLGYHTARYYAPWLGRWTSSDPNGVKSGVNGYSYVTNAPTRLVDPLGRDGTDRFVGGIKAVGGAFEIVAGGGLVAAGAATSGFLVGVPIALIGAAVFAHGIDTTGSGFNTIIEGRPVDTLTSYGLQRVGGMERNNANLVDSGISIVGSLGAGAATATLKVGVVAATDTAAQGMSGWKILTQVDKGSRALNKVDYAALGKGTTTALQKAAMLEKGVDTAGAEYKLTTTVAGRLWSAAKLIPTGPSPGGNIGVGALSATLRAVDQAYETKDPEPAPPQFSSATSSSTHSSVMATSAEPAQPLWSTAAPLMSSNEEQASFTPR